MSAPLAAALTDERMVGDWRLLRPLGQGAVGDVYLARHQRSDSLAAIKLLRDDSSHSRARALRLFEREHQAIARLQHPNIVSLYEMGDGWLATAYVEGQTLARRLQTPLEPSLAVRIARQIAAALAHAHERGVIHRDVKPANILLDDDDTAYLADFGLAVLAGDDSAPRAGTPGYMAPEQSAGEAVGQAADQYALGRTLLEMLRAGPLPGRSDQALDELAPGLPAALTAAVARATASEAAARFPSLAALDRALAAIPLDALPAPQRLAGELRVSAPFGWLTGADKVVELAPGIARADYRLGELARRGLIPAAAAERFLTDTGYGDFGWSLIGASDRLGPLDEAQALARTREILVCTHGFLCTRDAWLPLALAATRRNAQLLVLLPDVLGFGESPWADDPPARAHVEPRALLAALDRWLDLLGVRELPMAVVGHSAGAAALLAADSGPGAASATRIALTPIFPAVHRSLRWSMRSASTLARTTSRMPRARRMLAERVVYRSAELAAYTPEVRRAAADQFLAVPGRTFAAMLAAYADTVPADAEHLRRTVVVAAPGDPLVPADVLARGLARLAIADNKVHHLVLEGHYPQAEHATTPGLAAQTVADLVRIIEAVLVSTREGSLGSTEVASTMMSGGDSSTGPASSSSGGGRAPTGDPTGAG